MKKLFAILLVLVMMFSMATFVACDTDTDESGGGSTTTPDDSGSTTTPDDSGTTATYDEDTIKAWSDISIIVGSKTITVTGTDILALDITTFTTTNISSSGETTTVTVTGVSVAEILSDNGYDIDDMADATITASDGYVMTVERDNYSDIYLLLHYGGETLTAPRSCVKDARSMYWVKNIASVSFGVVEDEVTAVVSQVQFFFGNIFSVANENDAITPSTLTYDGSDYAFYSIKDYYDLFVGSDPSTISLIASGDFSSVVASSDTFYQFSISQLIGENGTHEDGSVYYSESASAGMKVKNLMYMVADGLAVSVVTTGNMSDVMSDVALAESDTYSILTTAGETVTVTSSQLSGATLYWSETYGQCIEFDNSDSLDDILGVDSISVSYNSTSIAGWNDLTIKAEGKTDIVLTAEDVLALDYQVMTVNQKSKDGLTTTEQIIIAFDLSEIVKEEWGVDILDSTFATVVATDDYSTELFAENYTSGLYIMVVYEGETLSSPRLCVPDGTSSSWAKNVSTITFVFDAE